MDVVRRLPLVTGILGGSLLLLNRLAYSPELLNSQSRSDALGVLLSALLILTGLLWQQVQPLQPKSVEMEGAQGFEIWDGVSDSIKLELAWATRTLLLASPAQSVAVWYRERLMVRRGILPDPEKEQKKYQAGELYAPGEMFKRIAKKGTPVYLVDTKLYPARYEFDYLPANTQAILCQPLGDEGVLVLGADAPRCFTEADREWIEAIAQKLDSQLSELDTIET